MYVHSVLLLLNENNYSLDKKNNNNVHQSKRLTNNI